MDTAKVGFEPPKAVVFFGNLARGATFCSDFTWLFIVHSFFTGNQFAWRTGNRLDWIILRGPTARLEKDVFLFLARQFSFLTQITKSHGLVNFV